MPQPPRVAPGRLSSLMEERALVVDLRPAAEFAAGHVPGTLNIPLNKSFTAWAGWLLPYDHDFFLLADGAERTSEAVRDLATIGLDRVAGVFDREALPAWTAAGCPLATVGETGPAELARLLKEGSVTALDVRTRAEWEAGHIPGVANIPLGELPDRYAEIPQGRPIVVHCQGGSRSAIAASLLQAQGRTEVLNLLGGFGEWDRAGQPVEREGPRGE
jgi:hydroxyacylglutathione hydrolase